MRKKIAKTYVVAVTLECPYCKETQQNSADGSLMWEDDHFPQDRTKSHLVQCCDCKKTFLVKRPKAL